MGANSSHGQLDIAKINSLGWFPKISEKEGFQRTVQAILNENERIIKCQSH